MSCVSSGNVKAPLKSLFLTLDPPSILKRIQEKSGKSYFRNNKSREAEKMRAEQSLRSVLSNLENLEYDMEILDFYNSIKGIPSTPFRFPPLRLAL